MGWFFTIMFVVSATSTSPQQRLGAFRTQQECEAAKLNFTSKMPAARVTVCTRERMAPGTVYVTPPATQPPQGQ